MRLWLDKAVTWRTTVSSYTQCVQTHTYTNEKMTSIWDISLIIPKTSQGLDYTNTHTHAGAVDPQVSGDISDNVFEKKTDLSQLYMLQ